MDIVLTIACLTAAIMLAFGKTIKIRVEHHHSADASEPVLPTPQEIQSAEMKAFDAALSEMHAIMGVNDDEN